MQSVEDMKLAFVGANVQKSTFLEHVRLGLVAKYLVSLAIDRHVDVLAEPTAVVVMHGLRVAEYRQHLVAIQDAILDAVDRRILVVAKDDEV